MVAAEDTRVTRRLLNHLGARPRLISLNGHNWRERLEAVLRVLERGDAALVSDAGMPGVSDPGCELVAAAAARGFRVESVPGPSAVTAALSVSGMPAGAFLFLGFLPRRRRERQDALRQAAISPFTIALFEAPHRLRAALEDIDGIFGQRPVAVCRELTKLHEEIFRGTAAAALEHFAAPRGEFAVVIGGSVGGAEAEADSGSETQDAEAEAFRFLAERRAAGMRGRDAVTEAAERFGIARNSAYRLWLEAAAADGG